MDVINSAAFYTISPPCQAFEKNFVVNSEINHQDAIFGAQDALQGAREKYGEQLPSLITFATGPSRTADIEKTLVVGVHGPKEVYLFLVEG